MQCKNSTKKEEIKCHIDKDLLLHSPPKEKAHSKTIHMKLCTRFCIKSRLVGSHEYFLVCGYKVWGSVFCKSIWGFSNSELQPVKMTLYNTSLLNPTSLFSPLTLSLIVFKFLPRSAIPSWN